MKLAKSILSMLVEGVDKLQKEYEEAGNSENYNTQLAFLKKAYDAFNKELFNGELKTPTIAFKRAMPVERTKSLGLWYPTLYTLKVDQRMMYAGWEIFREILAHEMCHQWCTDNISPNEKHGKGWVKKMTEIGVQPRLKIPMDPSKYRSPSETARLQKLKDMMDNTPKLENPEVGEPAKMLNGDGWVLGLFAGKYMVSNGVLVVAGNKLVKAPLTSIFKPTKEELKEIIKLNLNVDAYRK